VHATVTSLTHTRTQAKRAKPPSQGASAYASRGSPRRRCRLPWLECPSSCRRGRRAGQLPWQSTRQRWPLLAHHICGDVGMWGAHWLSPVVELCACIYSASSKLMPAALSETVAVTGSVVFSFLFCLIHLDERWIALDSYACSATRDGSGHC